MLLGVAQRLLRLLAPRDVAEVDDDRADGRFAEPVDDDRFHGAPRCVPMQQPQLERERDAGARGQIREQPQQSRCVLGMQQLEGAPPDELAGREAEQLLGRMAEEQHGAVGADQGDRIGPVFDQGAEPLLPLATRFLGLRLLLTRPLQVQRALDRRAESLQVVLHDVVGRARLHVFRGDLLVEAACDDDHRRVRDLLMDELQGIPCREARHRMVGEHQVGSEAAERVAQRLLRVDAARGTADARAADLALDELRVGRDVLHDEDARERGHRRQRGSSFSSTQ